MKAGFSLTSAESKRLIAKAVTQMPEVKRALEEAYVIVAGGTGDAYIAQELLGGDLAPGRFTAGVITKGVLCVTKPADRLPFPIILHKGKVAKKTIREALEDVHRATVVIKGANAVDPEGNAGVITSGFDGGTVGAFLGTVTAQGLSLIMPVGLEKLVPSVKESALYTGAKTFDYSMGAAYGMFCLTKANVVTEIRALNILFGVEAKHVASGGIGGSEGAVSLVVMGQEANVKAAIALVERVKGEPAVVGFKGDCASCKNACRFAGMVESSLPEWLRSGAPAN